MSKTSNKNFGNKVPVEIIIDSIVEEVNKLKLSCREMHEAEDPSDYDIYLEQSAGYNRAIDDVIKVLKNESSRL